MKINGEMLIGYKELVGSNTAIFAKDPSTEKQLAPAFHSASKKELDDACKLAQSAFDTYRNISLEKRASFLETIATEILDLGELLVQRTMAETGLPQMRIEGERGRTVNQLKLFANLVRNGNWVDARIDPSQPDRQPLARADLRLQHIPLGPVAIFGASNFPLAFSVAGGDTASALAAGCPVIVKAHSAHPGTSELIGKAIAKAARDNHMPDGVFSLIYDSDINIGQALVSNPAIKAVGFTGSRTAGLALMNIAATRPEPIPVYAEMSSINPVFLLPNKLISSSQNLAHEFVGSLTLGAGQFCTNPGLVIGIASDELDKFVTHIEAEVRNTSAQTMLTKGIHKAYTDGVEAFISNDQVTEVAKGIESPEPNRCQAHVFKTTAEKFIADPSLANEVFGSLSLVISCASEAEMLSVAEHLEGQLTATMQLTPEDTELARQLLTILERKAGRVLCNGFPTGVEVCHAMVHGGPFPATSDSRTTSVGSGAILRFLRPVCYQDMPSSLLPEALQDNNPLNIHRLIDGRLSI